MSRMSKVVEATREESKLMLSDTVENFMGGESYTLNPIDTLKMLTASSIFGEPSYYRGGSCGSDCFAVQEFKNGMGYIPELAEHIIEMGISTESTESVMIRVIDAALDYDFEETLKWAVELRNEYFMRLNPQVILVRAAMHPKRKEFTEKHPAMFSQYAYKVMARADDVLSGITYYMYANGGKCKMPSVLKRTYATKLGSLSRYQVAKYKNHEIGMIDAVRITHACSPVIKELMETGTVQVSESEETWERMRSAGKSWTEIFQTVNMGHMAMLRNISGFFTEVTDYDTRCEYIMKLKAGVPTGKQFPFRYYNAYKSVKGSKMDAISKMMILDALEDCIDIAVENMPKMHGKVAILSDNSASAWYGFNSEYGKVTVAEIDNLSAVLTAARADEGVVYKFGDTLRVFPISKRNGLLKQAMQISANRFDDVGGSTEGGIWEFFYNAIQNKEHWDSIFIYSDQQAGHGGLYGTGEQMEEYKNYICRNSHINVFKLVLEYRQKVYRKVNVFSVQTAGYDNNVLPQYAYRTNLMYGWTGRETAFADAMIKQWDAIESRA